MRINEVAKQFNIQSKDIIKYLNEHNIDVKSHLNTLDEHAVTLVKNKFEKQGDKPAIEGKVILEQAVKVEKNPESKVENKVESKQEVKPESKPESKPEVKSEVKSEATAGSEASAEAKKSTITAVFNPQNSRSGSGSNRQRANQGNNNQNRRPAQAGQQSQGSYNNQRPAQAGQQSQGSYNNQRPAQAGQQSQGSYNNQRPAQAGQQSQGSYNNQRPAQAGQQSQGSYNNQRPAQAGQQSQTGAAQHTSANKVNYEKSNQNRNSNYRPNQAVGTNPKSNTQNNSDYKQEPALQLEQQISKLGQTMRANQGSSKPVREKTDRFDKSSAPTNRPGQSNNNRPGQNGTNNRPGQSNNNNRPGQNSNNNRPGQSSGSNNRPGQNNNSNRPGQSGSNNRPGQYNNSNRPGQANRGGADRNNGKYRRGQTPATQSTEVKEEVIKTLILPEIITIKELAEKMKIQPSAIVKKLFLQGTMVTVNQDVDFATAEEIALEYNFVCEAEEIVDVIAELLKEDDENQDDMVSRPPVICVMGHVDHGKTSLLDAIRNTHVTAKESGGITQHIGAYVVNINNQKITFLDTPGHEAFTAMRMRGANSTDIAILVVAADDGVMPQTVEAINHAKAAGIEIIVAINKVDKASANIDRVKQELSEHELISEDWGGSTIFVPVSAHTGEGIEQLLEMILLTAEVCELKADPKRTARGLVIEAKLDKGKGAVATVLVQKGTLRVGQPIAAGSCFGKVRAMMDDKGRRLKEAGPSTPVEILGLSSVPNAGEIFVSTESEKEARSFAETFISHGRERLLEDTKAKLSLDDLFTQIQSGKVKELGIIIKADVQGSVEAVKQSLVKLSNEEVVVKIIHGGVGAINESDVILASASNAIIIGFNVRPDPTAKLTADREGVDLRLYKVIYNAIEDVEAAMKGMLDPVFEEKVLGHAEIRQIFKASGIGTIAGSYVLDGLFQRGCKVRISREGNQIFDGDLGSLKRFKDDVKEVKKGFECGLVFDGFNEVAEFDIVEAYAMVEVPR